jgi:hypothetical protein
MPLATWSASFLINTRAFVDGLSHGAVSIFSKEHAHGAFIEDVAPEIVADAAARARHMLGQAAEHVGERLGTQIGGCHGKNGGFSAAKVC